MKQNNRFPLRSKLFIIHSMSNFKVIYETIFFKVQHHSSEIKNEENLLTLSNSPV